MAIKFENVKAIWGVNNKEVTKIVRKSDGVVLWDKRRWVIKDGKLVSDWVDPTGYGIGRFLRASGVRWAPSSATQDDNYQVTQAAVTQKDGYVEIKYSNVQSTPITTGQLVALIGNIDVGEGSNGHNRRNQFRAIIGLLPKSGINNHFSTMTLKVLTGSSVTGNLSLAPTDGYSWSSFGEQVGSNTRGTTSYTRTTTMDHVISGSNPELASHYPWWHKNCTTQLSNINVSVGTGLVTSNLYFTWSDITMKVKELYYYE